MSGDDNSTSTYAPRSPDLSSFYSSEGPTQAAPQLQQPPTSHGQAGYKLLPPTYTYAASHAASSLYNYPPSSSYGAPPTPTSAPTSQPVINSEYYYQNPRKSQSYYGPPVQPSLNTASRPPYSLQLPTFQAPSSRGQPHPQQYSPPYSDRSQYLSPASAAQSSSDHAPSAGQTPPSIDMPPRKAAAPPPPPPPVIEPSPVKTKFPTARIKRIMQADEEVGKVAQQTPIAVGKALELFMIQMVTKSADVAKDKGSKRVTAAMLKQVVEMDEQWDFLRDIVSRVENEKEGSKSKAKAESESDEEIEEPKKRGRGRRKKVA